MNSGHWSFLWLPSSCWSGNTSPPAAWPPRIKRQNRQQMQSRPGSGALWKTRKKSEKRRNGRKQPMSQQMQDAAHHDPHGQSSRDTPEVPEQPHASEQATRVLASRLRGELLLPGNPDYEVARGVWNGAFDRHPALIVRCAGVEDVIAAVHFAREQALPLSVRSGGHSVAGYSTNEGGMVLDLSRMKAIRIDPEQRTARLEPGLTWGEVSHALQPSGLTLTAGGHAPPSRGGATAVGGVGRLGRNNRRAVAQ